jgi:hypothetical protein
MILLALLPTLVACHRPAEEPGRPTTPDDSLLLTGDLVYRFGNGVYSAYFRDVSQHEKRYSHVGIVIMPDNGSPAQVVHAEANDYTGQGHVRTEPLAGFLKEAHDWAVYRVQAREQTGQDIAAKALGYSERRVPFDLEFDAADTTAFYCTELVMHCVNDALGETRIRPNSRLSGRQVVAIDDTYLHDWVKMVTRKTGSK